MFGLRSQSRKLKRVGGDVIDTPTLQYVAGCPRSECPELRHLRGKTPWTTCMHELEIDKRFRRRKKGTVAFVQTAHNLEDRDGI